MEENKQLLDKDGLPLPKGEFTKELIEQVYGDLFNGVPKPKTRTPSIQRCEWEEDGEMWACWKIDTGSSIMYTNDAGKELFDKALEEDLKNNYDYTGSDKQDTKEG